MMEDLNVYYKEFEKGIETVKKEEVSVKELLFQNLLGNDIN